jgi:DHA1 family bicyclomycin/chloramphenicol resistance-like MFS transporter
MCVNLFLPALPAIQQQFAVPVSAVQSTVSSYLFAFAISILLAGLLADRYGRRPIIIGGLLVFTSGTVLCLIADSLQGLVLGRIVQAIGAACGVTVSRAIAGDVYQGEELARRLALLTMAMMLGTTLSPLIGGELAAHFGWHSAFLPLIALGLTAAVACYLLLPETHPPVTGSKSATALWREARKVIGKPVFFGYVLQAGVIYAVFLAFIAIAPYVMISVLHRPVTDFGIWYLLISAGYFLGNLYVSRGAREADRSGDRKTSSDHADQLMTAGLALQLAAAGLALAFALTGYWSPWCIFGPMLPLAFGQGLALPHISARAVQLAPGYSGVAAALIGFSQQTIAGISVQAMGFAANNSPVPIMLFCTLASALAFASIIALRGRSAS